MSEISESALEMIKEINRRINSMEKNYNEINIRLDSLENAVTTLEKTVSDLGKTAKRVDTDIQILKLIAIKK